MKIVVLNLGCKVNQYESDSIIKELREAGHDVVDELQYADAYILNTCAVTNEAERKSRQAVKRCINYNPEAKIYVCGCASQNNTEQFEEKNNVVYVSGVAGKYKIPAHLADSGVKVDVLPTVYEDDYSPYSMRTRSYVKIQDGCNNFCSYCLIPYLRGRSRSRSIASIVEECRNVADSKEIVLTGINISAYGKDTGSSLKELIDNLKDIDARIRLGSLEVNIISQELIDSLKGLKAFCPQFHLSLQSGSDSVLKKMNRHYSCQEYYDKVKLIRDNFDNPAITTDIICGFPTESDEEFEESMRFADKVKFADMHIFAYSRREGTKAANLPQIIKDVKIKRCEEMERICKKNQQEYLNLHIGKSVEILIEEEVEGAYEGYTREYMRARLVGNASQREIVNGIVTGIEDNKIIVERR